MLLVGLPAIIRRQPLSQLSGRIKVFQRGVELATNGLVFVQSVFHHPP